MDFGIRGKTALLLGSTRGLGFACAEALVNEGVRIVINGQNKNNGINAASKLGNNTLFVQADLNNPDERQHLYETAKDHLGSISIIVTNADGPPPGTFMSMSHQNWVTNFDRVVLSAMDLIKLCIPEMINDGFGRIINISSVSAKMTSQGSVFANSLKSGLLSALGTLAREIGETGVTVNSILPGPFNTDRMRKNDIGKPDLSLKEATKLHAAKVPMKRMGTKKEFGALCAFLCSYQASFITGQSIVIDGGYVPSLF